MLCWDDIVYKLPKGIKLSQYLKEKSLAYFRIKLYGHDYYVPITKDLKKALHLKIRRGKIIFSNSNSYRIEDYLRDVIDGIYLQVRDVVCAEIHQSLTQEIHEGFDKMFSQPLWNRIEGEANKKLLKEAKDG